MAEIKIDFDDLKKYVRNSILRAMRPVKNAVKADARRLVKPYIRRKRDGKIIRLRGTVADAVMVRKSKISEEEGNIGYFVNVKPIAGNKWKKVGTQIVRNRQGENKKVGKYFLRRKTMRGADNPRDPYYWRWLEFGSKNNKPDAFIRGNRHLGNVAKEQVNKDIQRYFK
jgi:hypothetical protein